MWSATAFSARGVAVRPVMRADDTSSVLAEIAAATAMHQRGVCLRLGSAESDPDEDAADALDALDEVGMGPAETHLVVDLWTVSSQREVAGALPVALSTLEWAGTSGPWTSVSLVSGAFPVSISNLPKGIASPLPRYDAQLYNEVIDNNPPVVPDYGDYAVASPVIPVDVPRGPLPNLRYTSDMEWQVYREKRALPGNQSFFTLCNRVVNSADWPAAGARYSWGDGEIHRCAGATGGAGRATEWRAYGTSHHLAHVVDRLATLGVP